VDIMTQDQNTRTFQLALEAFDAPAFMEAMRQAGYDVEDTGERVTTDAGLDSECVLRVTIPESVCRTRAQRVHDLLSV
jgi:hypothetical protein